jgi:hypothetical protein
MGVGGQRQVPTALPLGKTWYLLYRRLGGPQGRSGRVRKISVPPGFDNIICPIILPLLGINILRTLFKNKTYLCRHLIEK